MNKYLKILILILLQSLFFSTNSYAIKTIKNKQVINQDIDKKIIKQQKKIKNLKSRKKASTDNISVLEIQSRKWLKSYIIFLSLALLFGLGYLRHNKNKEDGLSTLIGGLVFAFPFFLCLIIGGISFLIWSIKSLKIRKLKRVK